MPLYEYECRKCKKRFEKIENLSGPHLKKCPSCGGAVERMMSAPAIQFKGTGWYVTDYGRGSGKNAARDSGGKESSATDSGSKEPGKGESSGGSEKSEAKSERKSESKSSGSGDKKKTVSKEK